MAILTLEALKSAVSAYLVSNKISYDTYTITRDNVANLIDKIGKITTLDCSYADKLSKFDGEFLSFGKDIEDWFEDLILPDAYDSSGSGALSPADPSYRPNFYSQSLGRKKFKTTIRYDNLERAVHNEGQFSELIAMITKRLYDSEAVFRYDTKRGILGDMINTAIDAMGTDSATFVASTAYNVGTLLNNGTKYGIVVQKIAVADAYATYADAETAGKIVTYHLVETLTAVTDTSSGEAFIEQVKKDIEKASDVSEGYSLNGNCLGAYEGLTLVISQGIMPVIETQVQAGAFHLDKVAIPCEIVVVPDFVNGNSKAFAILVDTRSVKLHPTYRAVRSQENGDGDFINYWLHVENTAYYCRNTFLKVYKTA